MEKETETGVRTAQNCVPSPPWFLIKIVLFSVNTFCVLSQKIEIISTMPVLYIQRKSRFLHHTFDVFQNFQGMSREIVPELILLKQHDCLFAKEIAKYINLVLNFLYLDVFGMFRDQHATNGISRRWFVTITSLCLTLYMKGKSRRGTLLTEHFLLESWKTSPGAPAPLHSLTGRQTGAASHLLFKEIWRK